MKMKKQVVGYFEVGDFLRGKRLASGKSQGDVRRELGYSTPQFISNWERGLSHPPHRDIRKIADVYGCNVEEFCEQYIQLVLQAFENELRGEIAVKKKSGAKK